MATIYLISGFLGAGKTTLIQKLLGEAFGDQKVALIENDFGDIGVDASLLGQGSVQVREINAGCICCSLAGDFVRAVEELQKQFEPDVILIEPSGVGKLSDLADACRSEAIQAHSQLAMSITVVDVKRCEMYLENFGEFFEDQVEAADLLLLSRVVDYSDYVTAGVELLGEINTRAPILARPWDELDFEELLAARPANRYVHGHSGGSRAHAQATDDWVHAHSSGYLGHTHHEGCCGGQNQCHGHDHRHGHGQGHGHTGHKHSAEEHFDTLTIRCREFSSVNELSDRMAQVTSYPAHTILRAKGIIPSENGYLSLQYVPESCRIDETKAGGNVLCFIGTKLDRDYITQVFGGIN